MYNDNIDEIKIKELDLDIIEPTTKRYMEGDMSRGGSKIVVIGKPGTGKSWLMRDIIYKKSHIFPVAMVQSGTEDFQAFYKDFIPSTFIHNNYDEEAIEKFLERQNLAKKFLNNPWAIICLDDFCDKPSDLRRPIQNKLFKSGRQKSCLYLCGIQYALDIPTSLRVCIDGVFLLREPNLITRKKLFENFGGVIGDFTLFCKLMDTLTDDNCAMYISNATVSNDWQDCQLDNTPSNV